MGAGERVRLRFVTENQSTRYAVWDNVLVAHGHQPLTEVTATAYVTELRKMLETCPQGSGVITIIERDSPPSPRAREIFLRGYAGLGDANFHAAFVIRTNGFLAATSRAIISGFSMATGRRGALHVTTSVADAVSWMAQRISTGALSEQSASALSSAITEFCPPPEGGATRALE